MEGKEKERKKSGRQKKLCGRYREERMLFFLLFFFLIALVTNLVLFGCFRAALVRAFLARSDSGIAARSLFLAFFAGFLVLMRLYTTLVITFFARGFCLYATALPRKDGAGSNHKGHSKGQSRQRFV